MWTWIELGVTLVFERAVELIYITDSWLWKRAGTGHGVPDTLCNEQITAAVLQYSLCMSEACSCTCSIHSLNSFCRILWAAISSFYCLLWNWATRVCTTHVKGQGTHHFGSFLRNFKIVIVVESWLLRSPRVHFVAHWNEDCALLYLASLRPIYLK